MQPGPVDEHQWLAHPVDPEGEAKHCKFTRPFEEHPTLFREFADLASSEDGQLVLDDVRDFAEKYGWLGLPEYSSPLDINDKPVRPELIGCPRLCHRMLITVDGEEHWAESIDAWKLEILNLSWAVRCWDFVKADHRRSLIRFRNEFDHMALNATDDLRLFLEGRLPPFVDKRERELNLSAALWRDAMAVLLAKNANRKLTLHAAPGMRFDFESKVLIPAMRPRNLIGLMWLQFMNATTTGQDFHHCEYCRHWVLRNDTQHQKSKAKHARYCGTKCKQNASTRRLRILRDVVLEVSWPKIAKKNRISVSEAKSIYQAAKEAATAKTGKRRKKK